MNTQTITVTDVDFFYAIENSIRCLDRGWAAYEQNELLPLAKSILNKSGFSIQNMDTYPIEGYYYKTPALTTYFSIIRNLQDNKNLEPLINKEWPEFKEIHRICSSPVFGPEEESDSPIKSTLLPRRKDILSRCIKIIADNGQYQNLKIPIIWEAVGKFKYDAPNLVELGYLTGHVACLACAAETNILYREISYLMSGCSAYEPSVIVYEDRKSVV